MNDQDDDYNYMFVTLVQSFPCLYDTAMAEFYQVDAQERAWAEIARDIGDGVTPNGCKTKWASLRDSYVQSLQAEGTRTEPKHQHLLRFLQPFVAPEEVVIKQEPVASDDGHSSQLSDEHQLFPEDDCAFNRALIAQVQHFPNVYQYPSTLPAIMREWRKISYNIEGHVNVRGCRRRWMWIRKHYAVYLEYEQQPALAKPYCLAEQLEFLRPFMTNDCPREVKIEPAHDPTILAMSSEEFDNVDYTIATLVQRYRCLYDHTVRNNKFLLIRRKSWIKISDYFGGTPTPQECRIRWRKLCHRYAAHLQNEHADIEPYYLADTLNYLRPYVDFLGTAKMPLRRHSFNLRLVELVKGFPCLYYSSAYAYMRSDLVKKAWTEVVDALGCGVTVKQCAERWISLRQFYLKQRQNKRPYYLSSALSFLPDPKTPHPEGTDRRSIAVTQKKKTKAEPKWNVNRRLVIRVKRFRCLYDTSLVTYKCADTNREAWTHVAKSIGLGQTWRDCAARWEYLRSIYIRHLTGTFPNKREHYLVKHLSFLKPFVCSNGTAVESKDTRDYSKSKRAKHNMKFVAHVREFPQLYDPTVLEYNCHKSVAEAWAEIARRTGTTTQKCRRLWIHVRHAYIKYVRGGTGLKYYLAEHLQFIRPFISDTKVDPGEERSVTIKPKESPFNCALVKAVSDFPVLYDSAAPGYGCGVSIIEAWSEVARRFGGESKYRWNSSTAESNCDKILATANECAMRWRNIRAAFTRHLRNPNQYAPYYLAEELQFMLPFFNIKRSGDAVIELTKSKYEKTLPRGYHFNCALVRAVKDFPVLYDPLAPGFQSPKPVKEAWYKIAKIIGGGTTANKCNLRWRNIRAAFGRYLKDKKQQRSYYLAELLQFLVPFMGVQAKAEYRAKKDSERHPDGKMKYEKRTGNDYNFSCALIKAVSDFPVLYDSSVQKSNTSDAWSEVARRVGDGATPTKCLVRWTNIRVAYHRSLNKGNQKQSYYLAEFLHFLLPFLDVKNMDSTVGTETVDDKRTTKCKESINQFVITELNNERGLSDDHQQILESGMRIKDEPNDDDLFEAQVPELQLPPELSDQAETLVKEEDPYNTQLAMVWLAPERCEPSERLAHEEEPCNEKLTTFRLPSESDALIEELFTEEDHDDTQVSSVGSEPAQGLDPEPTERLMINDETMDGTMIPEGCHFNYALVRAVQNFPVLYDPSAPGYQHYLSVNKAWSEVARIIGGGTTAKKCTWRWKNIRLAYSRCLNNRNQQRSYYLAELLQFMLPFMVRTKAEHCAKNSVESSKRPPKYDKKNSKDYEFTCKLVKAVSDFPGLYDPSVKEFNMPATWAEVARRVGDRATATKCLVRWRNIRTAYQRYLNNKNQKRSYYLAEFLQFILPFLDIKNTDSTVSTEAVDDERTPECKESITKLNLELGTRIQAGPNDDKLFETQAAELKLSLEMRDPSETQVKEEELEDTQVAMVSLSPEGCEPSERLISEKEPCEIQGVRLSLSPGLCEPNEKSIHEEESCDVQATNLLLPPESDELIEELFSEDLDNTEVTSVSSEPTQGLDPEPTERQTNDETMDGTMIPERYHFNFALVRAVQKFPMLYDPSAPGYQSFLPVNEAWSEVARIIGGDTTAKKCTLRWKNIRMAYYRYLNNKNQQRSYYLAELLQFMLPFMGVKARAKTEHCATNSVESSERIRRDRHPDEKMKYEKRTGKDYEFSCALAKAVSDFPVLYDPSVKEFNVPDAWSEVARRVGDGATATKCLIRWRNIRVAFHRYLNNKNQKRSYYLAEFLQFMIPFLDVKNMDSTASTEEVYGERTTECKASITKFNLEAGTSTEAEPNDDELFEPRVGELKLSPEMRNPTETQVMEEDLEDIQVAMVSPEGCEPSEIQIREEDPCETQDIRLSLSTEWCDPTEKLIYEEESCDVQATNLLLPPESDELTEELFTEEDVDDTQLTSAISEPTKEPKPEEDLRSELTERLIDDEATDGTMITEDYQFNCALVRAVRDFPVLYDPSAPAHKHEGHLKKAWNEVARITGGRASAKQCFQKWTILRNCFNKHLREATKKRSHYLAEPFQFLMPFMENENNDQAEHCGTQADGRPMTNAVGSERPVDHTKKNLKEYQLDFALVRAIRDFPVLYDHSVSGCEPKKSFKKVWFNVALQIGDEITAKECSERWSQIRISFSKYLGKETKKCPYYLAESLEFLVPFMRRNKVGTDNATKRRRNWYHFNCKFVKLVQDFPILYDPSTPGYDCNSSIEEAWNEVAQRTGGGATAKKCKEWWENIRVAFIGHLQDKTGRRPYDLAELLQFLVPFLEIGDTNEVQHSETPAAKLPVEPFVRSFFEKATNEDLQNEYHINSMFIRLVGSFPLLYDPSVPEHKCEDAVNNAWSEVAQVVGGEATAESCKKKWRYLRNSYHHCWTQNKTYYLADSFKFLEPFKETGNMDEEAVPEHCDTAFARAPKRSRIECDTDEPTAAKCFKRTGKFDNVGFEYNHITVDTADDDALFLLSLVPNFRRLGARQKRTFKARILDLTRQLLDED